MHCDLWKRIAPAAILVALALSPATARAGIADRTLDALVAGGPEAGGFVVDGWRFSEFAVSGDGVLDLPPEAVQLRIETLGDVERRASVLFRFHGDFQPGDTGKLVLDYRVDPAPFDAVTQFGTQFTSSVSFQGLAGTSSVAERVSTIDGSDIAPGLPFSDTQTLALFTDGPGPSEDDQSEMFILNPPTGLRLHKEFSLSAMTSAIHNFSARDEFFSVPEPAAVAFALPAAGALLARRRRVIKGCSHHLP